MEVYTLTLLEVSEPERSIVLFATKCLVDVKGELVQVLKSVGGV